MWSGEQPGVRKLLADRQNQWVSLRPFSCSRTCLSVRWSHSLPASDDMSFTCVELRSHEFSINIIFYINVKWPATWSQEIARRPPKPMRLSPTVSCSQNRSSVCRLNSLPASNDMSFACVWVEESRMLIHRIFPCIYSVQSGVFFITVQCLSTNKT